MGVFVLSTGIFGLSVYASTQWQYGSTMTPTQVTNYQGVEFIDHALHFTPTYPPVVVTSWWEGAYTTDTNPYFAQNGYIYNGSPYIVCQPGQSTGCMQPNTWAFFWTYGIPNLQQYTGSSVPASVIGASPTDTIYFTFAVYPAKNSVVFQFHDQTTSETYDVNECGAWSSSNLKGGAQAIVESSATSGFEGENVQQIALWAQSKTQSARYADTTNAFVYQTLPPTYPPLLYQRGTNLIDLGWNNGGSTYLNGHQLWSQTESSGLEQYPPTSC